MLAPDGEFVSNVFNMNSTHSIGSSLHRNWPGFSWIVVGIDDQILEFLVRSSATRIAIAYEADDGPVERDRHVKRPSVG